MEIERNILAWVTRADMFILSAWPFVLLALSLVGIALFSWTVSKCVMSLQADTSDKPASYHNVNGRVWKGDRCRKRGTDDP